jgi:hypothetical protein
MAEKCMANWKKLRTQEAPLSFTQSRRAKTHRRVDGNAIPGQL